MEATSRLFPNPEPSEQHTPLTAIHCTILCVPPPINERGLYRTPNGMLMVSQARQKSCARGGGPSSRSTAVEDVEVRGPNYTLARILFSESGRTYRDVATVTCPCHQNIVEYRYVVFSSFAGKWCGNIVGVQNSTREYGALVDLR